MRLQTFRTDVYRQPESRKKINVACKVIKHYVEHFSEMEAAGMGLYLVSETKGSGKTRMAASLVNELMEKKNKQVKFATSTSILQEIKRTWSGESEYSESRLIDQLCTTNILVIDDFGTEKVSDWVRDKFYQIINERYSHKKISIFTSNVPLHKSEYDERITDRIKEMCYQIEFPEESVRELIAKQHAAEMIKHL